MKKITKLMSVAALAVTFLSTPTFAESCTEGNTGLSISPVSKTLTLEGGMTYDDETFSFTVKNVGTEEASFRVYASPYSAADEDYNMNFSDETNYTQISRWISFKDSNGNYSNETTFSVPACSDRVVEYRVVAPESIPNGGQYAVIFAEGINDKTDGGIKAISRVGLLVYGRASGTTINTAEISDLSIIQGINENLTSKDGKKITTPVIYGTATVKDTGNVDVVAQSKLVIKNLFGGEIETVANNSSVLPESTRKITEVWENTPYFGLFWVTFSVTAAGITQEATQLVLLMPAPILMVILVLIAIVVIWIVALVKKNRARKSRYMV